ncbi:MAG TPA: HWE histidine kinase domain-containing protein [Rhizomicrobium sp.]|nr:HWE histidine kinase domain-containing protein [Rhizomicrobium sp.]
MKNVPPLDAELARQILEAAPTVIYAYDVQSQKSVFQNRRFGELLGHPQATHPPENDWRLHIHPDDAALFPAHRERLKAIRHGETLSWEFRMRDVHGGWRWFLSRDTLLSRNAEGAPLLVVGSAFDITEQKRAEEHKELLADEMRHRARNLVSLVQAIGRMSRPKDQPEVGQHIDALMGRLLTLLKTGSILLSSSSRSAELREILESALAPFNHASRFTIEGPSVVLTEHTAGGLGLAFHELATNAVKYGALSQESGRIAVVWALENDGAQFVMEWKESGGPPVAAPNSEGFGALVIRQSVARERNGRIALDYLPDGLRCRFEFEMGA